MSRVFLTVLDAVGAGEAPDAADYGDAGTNTLGHVIASQNPKLPNMAALGLGKIPGTGYQWDGPVCGAYGRGQEVSKGKDTTSGHWEIAGIILDKPFNFTAFSFGSFLFLLTLLYKSTQTSFK